MMAQYTERTEESIQEQETRDSSGVAAPPSAEKPTTSPSSPSGRSFSDLSPQEAHDRVKETVSKAIATAAGAVEGIADTMKKNDVPEKTREAVQSLGDTTRSVGNATKEEFQKTKQEFRGESGSSDTKRSKPTKTESSTGPY